MSDNKFSYRYSAPTKDERREIEDIKRRYVIENKGKSDFDKLKELDAKVKNPPLILSLTLGICGTLLFGLGLTMVLEWKMLLAGIIIMFVACVPVAAAYPVYNVFLKKNKEKYSDEIIKLSDNLLSRIESEDKK